jgi:hypothetical protein
MFDEGHLPAAGSTVQMVFAATSFTLGRRRKPGRAMLVLAVKAPSSARHRVVIQEPSGLYPNRAKLYCKLRAGVEVIHGLFGIARREAKDRVFKPNPEKSLG